MNDDLDLSAAVEYEMTTMETLAYRAGLYWIHHCHSIFPDYRHQKGYPKKGDPRRCSLFKFCYKLIRESQGVIKPQELGLYIKSQLDMLKAITQQSDFPFIGPQILVGDKAWVRWKMWKRQYDAISKRQTLDDANLDVIPFEDIKKGLEETKQFLVGKFEGEPKEEQIMMGHTDINRWVGIGKISPFYVILSPWVKKHVKIANLDPLVYEKSVTQDVIDLFKNLFYYEMSKADSK